MIRISIIMTLAFSIQGAAQSHNSMLNSKNKNVETPNYENSWEFSAFIGLNKGDIHTVNSMVSPITTTQPNPVISSIYSLDIAKNLNWGVRSGMQLQVGIGTLPFGISTPSTLSTTGFSNTYFYYTYTKTEASYRLRLQIKNNWKGVLTIGGGFSYSDINEWDMGTGIFHFRMIESNFSTPHISASLGIIKRFKGRSSTSLRVGYKHGFSPIYSGLYFETVDNVDQYRGVIMNSGHSLNIILSYILAPKKFKRTRQSFYID